MAPLENHKAISFLRSTVMVPLENHKAIGIGFLMSTDMDPP